MVTRRSPVPPIPPRGRSAAAADVLASTDLDSVIGMTGRADLRLGITAVVGGALGMIVAPWLARLAD